MPEPVFHLRPRPGRKRLLVVAAATTVLLALSVPTSPALAARGKPPDPVPLAGWSGAGVAPAARPVPDQVPPVPPPAPGTYQPPVLAAVVDGFRPPAQPWQPGNRGLEYATVPGVPISAVGAGQVVFAGPVAGSLHVTVLHPDGIRTSYSFLAAILVTLGQLVAKGQILGTAGARFHVGARIGDAYIDPSLLWGDGAPHVFLVPLDGAGPGRPLPAERAPLVQAALTPQPPVRQVATIAANFAAGGGAPLP